MGCVQSKSDINDLHPNIFQVMNVDQRGNKLSPAQLEITESDLVLYQRKKTPIKWPLRRLRRYGFEGELFSFESGRRCPTGPGIYAFHCLRAERLFNLVQTHIQVRNIVGEDGVVREFPSIGPVVPVRVNSVSGNESNYLEPAPFNLGNVPPNIRFVSENGGNPRRPGSVGSSNGPTSPQGTMSPSPPPVSVALLPLAPPPPTALTTVAQATNCANNDPSGTSVSVILSQDVSEDNNNKPTNQATYINSASGVSSESLADSVQDYIDTDVSDHVANEQASQAQQMPAYINVDLGSTTGLISPTSNINEDSNYARLEIGSDPQHSHLYMNVTPRPDMPIQYSRNGDWPPDDTRHCYANLEPGEIEVARSRLPKWLSGSERLSQLALPAHSPLCPSGVQRQVNYIVLDLDQAKKELSDVTQPQPTTPVTPVSTLTLAIPSEVPGKASEGYTTIDFNKTVALSHSVNPNVDNDSEGSRKTRHNSTVNDLSLPFE